MTPLEGVLCSSCGESIPGRHFHGEAGLRCVLCEHTAPPFQQAVAFGAYAGALRDLVHLFKYQQVHSAGPLLGRFVASALSRVDLRENFLLIPVPLSREKRSSRGFNQAEEIARNFLRVLPASSIQINTGTLIRTRETASQTGLTRPQRQSNLRGAFAVKHPERVRGRSVLIVDDVMTTGATASECARVLLRAGASQVFVVTVARAIKNGKGEGLPASMAGAHQEGPLGHA
ncbi:MAG TPA: ComF family protein [Candidatus Angelobacter sp.]|nr:ComF family protein [Candidatus Angelobacter sp.]